MIVLKKELEGQYDSIKEVYEILSCILQEEGIIKNKQNLVSSLIQREELGPVEIMPNFYLPHIKTDEIEDLLIVNVEGFKNNKILFILVPEENFLSYRECVIKIIMKLDEKDFIKKMESSEKILKEYLESIQK